MVQGAWLPRPGFSCSARIPRVSFGEEASSVATRLPSKARSSSSANTSPGNVAEQEVVGREPELAAISWLLDSAPHGPAVLAFLGEAGIGKTTVWAAGADEARKRRFTVLSCRPASAEMRLSYAGLTDLLADVRADAFEQLPHPQRRALGAARLRITDDGPAPDPRAVAVGLLSVLDGLTRDGPLLLAIDDIQWLDRSTRAVVDFAVRRCAGAVAVLVAQRAADQQSLAGELSPRDRTRQRTLRIGPLSAGALHRLIRNRLERSLPRHTMLRIAQLSGGNPFFALELARSLGTGASIAGAVDLAELPATLISAVDDRVGKLSPPVREALLVASALAAPRLDLVEHAVQRPDVVDLLGVAEDAGVVELTMSGAVRFTHPLLAAGVYAEAPPSTRRALHRQLGHLVDDEEERARHLALAAVGPDPETVEALDSAAARARRRGAPIAAAELLELAIGLGADEPARRVRAARDHFHASNPGPARELLEGVIGDLERGTLRAEALFLLAVIGFESAGDPASSKLLEQAMTEAASGTPLRFSITFELAYQLFNQGDLPRALVCMQQAVSDAEQLGDDSLLAEALAGLVNFRFLTGGGTDQPTLARALALENPARRSRAFCWPTLIAGLIHAWSYHLDEAHAAFLAVRERCAAHGFESELMYAAHSGISVACALGEISTAGQYVDELVEQSQIIMSDQTRAVARTFQAELWAWIGRIDEARSAGQQALTLLSGSGGVRYLAAAANAALGMAELSVGNADEAARRLVPAMTAAAGLGIREPQALPHIRDVIDALVEVGQLDDAEPLVEQLEANARRPDRLWSRAMGARGRGLLLAARNQPDEAFDALEQALSTLDRLPRLRYDRARTLLVLGRLQRRRGQRGAARESLEEAGRLFEEIGAAQWARNARAALERLGLRAGSSGELTPTEQRIAELAASGLTNKQIATARFVSAKTVEAQLSRVYRKLGVLSRAQLAHLLARRREPPDTLPSSQAHSAPGAPSVQEDPAGEV
jgi:DNA-binding CsgD family transcriptional regulator